MQAVIDYHPIIVMKEWILLSISQYKLIISTPISLIFQWNNVVQRFQLTVFALSKENTQFYLCKVTIIIKKTLEQLKNPLLLLMMSIENLDFPARSTFDWITSNHPLQQTSMRRLAEVRISLWQQHRFLDYFWLDKYCGQSSIFHHRNRWRYLQQVPDSSILNGTTW